MKIHLSGRGVGVSAALRRRVETKVAKVVRLLPKTLEARIVLGLERHRHLAELTLQAEGATLRAEAAASDFYAAVDLATDNLEQQVRRRKDRIRARKPRVSRRGARAPAESSPPPVADDGSPVLLRRLSAKPMSVEEALEQLRERQDSLLIFMNARSRAINVLHRRADGLLELVQPAG
ncbi:MAG: ribosome hibernation-promoting factor, HPF/YfiA family [Candidatus Rokuibacteriota bacterium]